MNRTSIRTDVVDFEPTSVLIIFVLKVLGQIFLEILGLLPGVGSVKLLEHHVDLIIFVNDFLIDLV